MVRLYMVLIILHFVNLFGSIKSHLYVFNFFNYVLCL